MNHHGHHVPEHKNGDAETLRQCKIIADEAREAGDRAILAGDFNLVPNSESIEQINTVLTNQSLEHKLTTTRNQLTTKNEVCDYIFTGRDIEVLNFKIIEEQLDTMNNLQSQFNRNLSKYANEQKILSDIINTALKTSSSNTQTKS